MKSGASLGQHPRPGFLHESKAVAMERRRFRVGMNRPGFAHQDPRVRQKDVDHGTRGKVRRTSAEKAAEADILGSGFLLNCLPLRIGLLKDEWNAQANADLSARYKTAPLGDLRKRQAQRIKIDWFLEVSISAKLFALFLGLRAAFAADDNDGDFLCVAKSSKGLKQFVAG